MEEPVSSPANNPTTMPAAGFSPTVTCPFTAAVPLFAVAVVCANTITADHTINQTLNKEGFLSFGTFGFFATPQHFLAELPELLDDQ